MYKYIGSPFFILTKTHDNRDTYEFYILFSYDIHNLITHLKSSNVANKSSF